ncbi:hypothetical protein NMY22_g13430 [Coprinellus aureogranulatus]|nr:hypothetical protein NMY22_g13430 [Coprinellus aureogranulatus]
MAESYPSTTPATLIRLPPTPSALISLFSLTPTPPMALQGNRPFRLASEPTANGMNASSSDKGSRVAKSGISNYSALTSLTEWERVVGRCKTVLSLPSACSTPPFRLSGHHSDPLIIYPRPYTFSPSYLGRPLTDVVRRRRGKTWLRRAEVGEGAI